MKAICPHIQSIVSIIFFSSELMSYSKYLEYSTL
jgi:hypothetical protein